MLNAWDVPSWPMSHICWELLFVQPKDVWIKEASYTTHHPRYWIIQDKHWPTLEKQMKRKWKQDTWQQQGNHGNSDRLCLLYFGQNAQRAEPSALQFQPLRGESLLHSPSPSPGPAFVQPLQGEFCFSGLLSPPQLPWLPADYTIQWKSYNSSYQKRADLAHKYCSWHQGYLWVFMVRGLNCWFLIYDVQMKTRYV